VRQNGHAVRVLVADGDAVSRAESATALRRSGLQVSEAESGPEAVEVACEEEPSAVVLDVNLPMLCGYIVCRSLRDEFGDTLAIVVVSADRTAPVDRVASLLIGADDFLAKPLSHDELVTRVTTLAGRTETLRARKRRPRQGVQLLGVLPITAQLLELASSGSIVGGGL